MESDSIRVFIRHGNSLQYSCPENPRKTGAWWSIVHGEAESDTTEVTKHTHTQPGARTSASGEKWERVSLLFHQSDEEAKIILPCPLWLIEFSLKTAPSVSELFLHPPPCPGRREPGGRRMRKNPSGSIELCPHPVPPTGDLPFTLLKMSLFLIHPSFKQTSARLALRLVEGKS